MRLVHLSLVWSAVAIAAVACTNSGVSGGDGSGGAGPGSGSGGGTSSSGGATSRSGGATSSGGAGTSTGTGGSTSGSGGRATSSGGRAGTASGGATSSGGAGTSTGTGGSTSGTGGAATGSGGAVPGTGGAPITGGTLPERIVVTDVTVPAGVKAGVNNWRIWASTKLKISPVYTVPLANCGTLVCFTTGTAAAPNARVVRLDVGDHVAATIDLGAGLECRGLAAEPDGHFGALLWSDAMDKIWVKRYDLAGAEQFAVELTNSDNHPNAFDIGEARMEFGAGKYGAYYHVHSDSGHEGDTLKFVTTAGVASTQWSWGCSHSMSDLLTFSPSANTFLPSCVTDCYPGTGSGDFATVAKGGIYTDNAKKIMDVPAGCNGSVAGELGGAAVAPVGWKLVFNAYQGAVVLGDKSYTPSSMNQDIGFASVAANHSLSGGIVWLTTTTGNEADSAMARWEPSGDTKEQYVVGWLEGTAVYKLSRVDAAGAFIEPAVDVTAKAKWGQRDDPFRVHMNKDIVWSYFDAANATTMHVARLRSGGTATCAAF